MHATRLFFLTSIGRFAFLGGWPNDDSIRVLRDCSAYSMNSRLGRMTSRYSNDIIPNIKPGRSRVAQVAVRDLPFARAIGTAQGKPKGDTKEVHQLLGRRDGLDRGHSATDHRQGLASRSQL